MDAATPNPRFKIDTRTVARFDPGPGRRVVTNDDRGSNPMGKPDRALQ